MKEFKRLSEHYGFTVRQEQRIEDLIKDISIGFAEYYLTYKILAQHQIDEQKTVEEKFNEYLNTLK